MEITLCDPTCFFFFFKNVNEVWQHVTLCDPKQCRNVIEPVLACSNMPLNATLFKGDLLESYESPTIFAQSDIMCHWADVKNGVKYMHEVQWLFVVMFSTYFLPKQMTQNRRCKNVHEVQFISKTWFPMMFSSYVSTRRCFFLICFATPDLQNHMNH